MKFNDRQLDWTFEGGGYKLVIEKHGPNFTSYSIVKDEQETETKEVKKNFIENIMDGFLSSSSKSWYQCINERFDALGIKPKPTVN